MDNAKKRMLVAIHDLCVLIDELIEENKTLKDEVEKMELKQNEYP